MEHYSDFNTIIKGKVQNGIKTQNINIETFGIPINK